MNLTYALAIALIAACGIQLMLSRHIVRIILGVTLLSAAVNLIIFYTGRIVSKAPPVMMASETTLPADAANPLPQALILTAIVIGFSLTAFAAGLALQTFRSIGTLDGRRIRNAERLGSAFDSGERP